MTYTRNDAIAETMIMFEEALHSLDSDHVYTVAQRLAGAAGFEEEAEILHQQAIRLSDNDWVYDRAVDNAL